MNLAAIDDALTEQVRAWAAVDPDQETREAALRLLELAHAGDEHAVAELHDAFDGRLRFGTAGLRAALGPGPRRMNRLVVAQSTAGLAAFLHERVTDRRPQVVIGYDARKNSEVFAADAAAVFSAAGITAIVLPEPTPTPVTAFAVRHLNTDAGVMITASHNPPNDNGYKVYLGGESNGRQICAPDDRAVTAHITACISEAGLYPATAPDYLTANADVISAYIEATATHFNADPDFRSAVHGSRPTVVYTALHGVGGATTEALFARLGLPTLTPVDAQHTPDGRFPTLSYPNPEDPRSLALAFQLASKLGADAVLAHDPDGDRLALAAPHPDDGAYRTLTGNELGLLLGWRAAEREANAAASAHRAPRGVLANTVVSSPALGRVAAHYGLNHVETLAGFKWVSRVPDLLFGFEEALGYLIDPDTVGDKDGLSAAADTMRMLTELHQHGQTVWQLLDQASETFGHFASAQIVMRCVRDSDVRDFTDALRAAPPTHFAGRAVRSVRDFSVRRGNQPRANILAYALEDESRVMVRPSGTEPKLKVYLDACGRGGDVQQQRLETARALAELEASVRDLLAEPRDS